MINFPAVSMHQGRADFDNFHFGYRPATFIGGGLQINHQPVRHCRVPGIGVLMALSVVKPGASA
jgi:hypothetical protein